MAFSYTSVDVSSASAYPTDPQVVIGFVPRRVVFISLDTATKGATYSFDGANDHGYIPLQTGGCAITLQPNQRIWLKRQASGATTVFVSAEDAR